MDRKICMNNPNLRHYDVIIIGAGSIGAPAAFYLSQAGFKVLVLDRAPSVGQTSNKRAIGGIRATHSDPAKIRLSLRSIEIFSTWKERYGDEIEWSEGGYVFVARSPREENILKDLLVTQKSFGLNINWLDRKELLEVVPDLNPGEIIGGTFSPEDGNASPLLAVHAFYTHAMEYGAEFRFNEQVQEIVIQNGKAAEVKTNRGEYGTDWVINAAGAYAAEIAQLAGLTIPVRPDSHEAAITEAVAPFLKPMIVDIQPGPGSSNYYFYQHLTGQIIFCITPSPNIWGFDTEETSSFLPMVAKRIVDLMPRLKNIRVRRTWRGLYPMTPDGAPIVGKARELDGFVQAAGMCGQGFMLGPGVGELVTRLVADRLLETDYQILEILSPYRQFAGEEMLK
jgi:sarcosine oxidase subunit beta